jgi:HYDIN/CFA65/VesB family protein
MRSNWERTRGSRAVSVAVILLVLMGAVSLTGCQGVSARTSSQSGSGSPGQLSVTPTTITVGNVSEGSSGTATATLSARGNSVTVESVVSNNSAFTVGGLFVPLTIAAGQSASFTVTFSPMTTGAQTAALTFTSDAQNATTMVALAGTGMAASTRSVALSWNASTSANILGYNVYRAVYNSSSCGSYSKINAVLNTGTLYTDLSVLNGTSYCYASTAVNTSNEESVYSNVVSNVQIP